MRGPPWGLREQRHSFQGNMRIKAKFCGEQGKKENIRNREQKRTISNFGEQGIKLQGNKETGTPQHTLLNLSLVDGENPQQSRTTLRLRNMFVLICSRQLNGHL